MPGKRCPEPSNYLSEIQRDGKPLGADLVYRETWQWLDQRGCSHFVAPRLIEAYAQAFARYVQCEQAISEFRLLGKHPTTGAAIASPFVAMSQSFGKRANVYWYEIDEIVRATCTTDYAGTTPGEEVMAAGRRIIVTGEITTNHRPRIRESVRTALARAGYSPLGILIYVWTRRQSSDINAGSPPRWRHAVVIVRRSRCRGLAIKARSTVTPPPRPLNASRSRSSWHIAPASVSILPRSRGRSAGSTRTARPR